mgnify:CR=1 FL=1
MGKKKLVEAGVDLLGDVIDTTTEAVKKKLTKSNTGKQDDLFPETIPTTSEGQKAANKLSAAEKRKFKKAQTDMFSEELKDATEARKVKAVKNRKNAMKTKKKKAVKKAAGGPIQKFGAGGEIGKGLWKGAKWVGGKLVDSAGKVLSTTGKATGKTTKRFTKAAAEGATKKAKALIAKKKQKIIDRKKTETKVLNQQKNWSKSAAGQKRNYDELPDKTKEVIKKHNLAGGGKVKKYAHGGTVRKSIDGIAQRGLTRAKHK